MGFQIAKKRHGFAPVLVCDICGENRAAKDMNFDHSWDCSFCSVVCKKCCVRHNIESEAWMEMTDYITCLVLNSKVDIEDRKKYQEIV
jgi:hypothetical protein